MHLLDAFIQSDLQCIQAIHFFLSVCVFPGNWTHNLCAAKAKCSTTEPQEHVDPHVVPNKLDLRSSSELIYSSQIKIFLMKSEIILTLHRHLDSNATDTSRAQKGSKDIVKISPCDISGSAVILQSYENTLCAKKTKITTSTISSLLHLLLICVCHGTLVNVHWLRHWLIPKMCIDSKKKLNKVIIFVSLHTKCIRVAS